MLHSARRILTTHAGSLPRPKALVDLLVARSRREAVDAGAFARAVDDATRHVIAQQAVAGIDIGTWAETLFGTAGQLMLIPDLLRLAEGDRGIGNLLAKLWDDEKVPLEAYTRRASEEQGLRSKLKAIFAGSY